MRRILLLLLLVTILLTAPVAAARKDFSADGYDVDVAVQEDGSILVQETVVFQFVGGPFTTVFRDLVTDETDGLTDISAKMDGTTLPPGTGAGQVEIKGGSPINVQWHFQPTSDAPHTFELSYRMLGAIRQDNGADVLSYRALPTEHDYPIASSTVRITFPGSAELLAAPSIVQGAAEVDQGPSTVTLTSGTIPKNGTLRFALRFAPGSLISAPPLLQATHQEQNGRAPAVILVALALFGGGCAALAVYWRQNRRTAPPPPIGELSVMKPPAELPPAIAGMLKDDAYNPEWSHALGTLLDLGRRGVLVIEESPEHSWYRRQDFIIRQVAQLPDPLPHESGLLALLFKGKTGMSDSVKVSALASGRSGHWKLFSEPLQDEMRAGGIFSPDRERIRKQFMVIALLLLAVGGAGFLLAIPFLNTFGGWAMLVPFSIMGLGIVALVLSAALSPLSEKAAMERPRWQAFARYLKDVAKGKQPFVGSQLLEEYLPYAASLGLAEDWAKLFKQREGEDVLAWFRPLSTSPDGGSAAFIAMIGATSSAGSSGAAGGAGAAGGGASGAH